MRDLGDASAEVWDAEWRRSGRVVFPLRRRSTLLMFLFQILPAVVVLGSLLLGGAPAPGLVDALFLAPVCALVIGIVIYRLVARRPVVVVDRDGIRHGRRRFLPWSAISGLGVVSGPPFDQTFLVIRQDLSTKNIRLRQQNIRNLPQFRHWLGTLLVEHRQAGEERDRRRAC
ncbi:hypothetical protein ACXJJ3_30925 [Kribbella sp. WER1]